MLIQIDIKKAKIRIKTSQMQFINQEIKKDKKACPGNYEMVWLKQWKTEFKLSNRNMNENIFIEIWAVFRLKLDYPGK